MKYIHQLEKKLGWIAIPHLTYYLIAGQAMAFILITANPIYENFFVLQGDKLMKGEWWRAISFLFEPATMDILFLTFALYLYYLYGTALERLWGSFRYTLYFLISYLATVVLALFFPFVSFTNIYLYTSLFLAFAFRFPNFELMLFFILPVKIKWFALLTWIGIGGSLIFGSLPTKVLTLVSLLNFFLFFGGEIKELIQRRLRGGTRQARTGIIKAKPQHVCAVCHKNEIENPDMGIRYCSKCSPSTCYCEEHIHDHEHKNTSVGS